MSKSKIEDVVEKAILIAFDRFVRNEIISEFDFPSSFTSAERAFVHDEARERGLLVRNIGHNSNKFVSIHKKRFNSAFHNPIYFKCGQNSTRVINTLLQKCPVKQKEKQEIFLCHEKAICTLTDFRSDMSKPSGRLPNGIPQIPNPRMSSSFDDYRNNLPIVAFKDEITRKIRDNQVVIICGEGGVGKTTQVPQFILDDHLHRKEACRIVCTQTHRINAVSMAERVANERGESVGQTVGYQIRLESRASPRTLLTICTNGVLTRTLMSRDGAVKNITHIIVDEIQERDHHSDFLLIKLRYLLCSSQPQHHFRLILLSSVNNVKIFQDYFKDSAVVKVSRKVNDFEEFYLDHILKSTNYLKSRYSQIDLNVEDEKKQAEDLKLWLSSALSESSKTALQTGFDLEVQSITAKSQNNYGVKTSESYYHFDNAVSEAWVKKNFEPLEKHYKHITAKMISADARHSKIGLTALMTAAFLGNSQLVDKFLAAGANPNLIAPNGMTAADLAKEGGHLDLVNILSSFCPKRTLVVSDTDQLSETKSVQLYYKKFGREKVDIDLIICLLSKICNQTDEGSILVFLPTYDDIIRLSNLIKNNVEIANRSNIRLHVLLSSLQLSNDQKQAFQPSTAENRKIVRKIRIILATNIAESSVTIDDVRFVIDTGKSWTTTYDPLSSMAVSKCDWISQENVLQRKSLASRVRNGQIYHMYSESVFHEMQKQIYPQLSHVPLHEICLQVKLLYPADLSLLQCCSCSIKDYLLDAPTKPPVANIESALKELKEIEALDSDQNVTEIGKHLIDLPIDPRLGKMVLYGVVLKCLDPILTIACSLAHNYQFIYARATCNSRNCDESQEKFSAETFSDHMCLLRAFQAWQKARSDGWEKDFCENSSLSQATMEMIVGMRSQLLGQLRATGFVRARGGNDIRDLNTNSENWAVVKAALCASSFPNILYLDRKLNQLFSANSNNVWVDSSSVLSRSTNNQDKTHATALNVLPSEWLIYNELQQTSSDKGSISLAKCCTVVSSLCVALFAGQAHISEAPDTMTKPMDFGDSYGQDSESENDDKDLLNFSQVKISDWIKMYMEPNLANTILQLRTKWYSLFFRRIHNPSKLWQVEDETILSAIIHILSSEDQSAGLTQPSGIGQRPKPVIHMDEKNKSPCFIPKTPTSEDKSNIEQITNQESSVLSRRRKSRTLDFSDVNGDGQHKNIDPTTTTTNSIGAVVCKAVKIQKSPYQIEKASCCFVYTISRIQELQQLKSTGKWNVAKNLRQIFIERLKHEHVYVFFILDSSETIQDIIKLETPSEGSFQFLWLKQNRASGRPIKRLWENANNQQICENVIILKREISEILLQLIENVSSAPLQPKMTIPAAQTPIRGFVPQNFNPQQQFLVQSHPVAYYPYYSNPQI